MKPISSIVWLVLGLTLAGLLFFTWFWFDQQAVLGSSVRRITEADDPAIRIELTRKLLAGNAGLTKGQRAMFLGLIAEAFARRGDLDSMAAVYDQAIELKPDDVNLHNNAAYEMARLGARLDQAERYAIRAVALARAEAAGKPPAGADRASWTSERKQTLGNCLDTHGWVLYRKGDYPGAESQLRQALQQAPEAEIRYHLGMALYRSGKLDQAVDHLAASLAGRLEQPDSALAHAQQAYRERHGSLRGFDQLAQRHREEARRSEQAGELAQGSALIGQPAPDFTLPDLDGKPHRLSDLRGRVVIIDFWATWCRPCVMAMPLVDKVQREHRERGVAVLGVNLEGRDKIEQVRKFVDGRGVGFTILVGGMMGNGLDRVYGVTGIPTTFVVDRDGVVRHRHIGYRENLDQLLSGQIAALLKAPEPPGK